ncbi:MAG: NAD-dependent epimerase/dehydratase family protein [Actinomycetota bacterium]|nr:NAD-dependent epimerase/dehydratase family protein [Actinomycetota bacterium]
MRDHDRHPDHGTRRPPRSAATDRLHVVLGGGGGIGAAIVRRLVADGRRVRAVGRSLDPAAHPGAEVVRADITTADGIDRACAGAHVVFQAAQPAYHRWDRDFEPMTESVLGGVARHGARFVQIDNLYAYGPTAGPMTEETPRRATGRKGATRIRMERRLLEAHERGEVPVVIGRASDVYGRGARSTLSALVLDPAAAGRAMRWPADLDAPHTLHHVDDLARAFVALADADDAYGRVWHLPAPEPITGRELCRLVNAALDEPVAIGTLSRTVLRVGGLFSRDAREVGETWYQWSRPFVSDASRFERRFGALPMTPHVEAIAATVTALGAGQLGSEAGRRAPA